MQLPTEKHLDEFQKDEFGFKTLSKNILDQVLLSSELPNCFGLYGNWGSGKSTLMHFVIRQIESQRRDVYKTILPVYFESWKYEHSDEKDLLFALLNIIEKNSGEKYKEKFKELKSLASAVFTGTLRTVLSVDVQDVKKDIDTFNEMQLTERQQWVDDVEGFKNEFESLVKNILDEKDCQKMFIFIDDLDRCLPQNAVKLLEAIKNYLSVPQTLFILAIDRRVIAQMVQKKYGLYEGYGDEYLTKIVHYYYELPPVDFEKVARQILNQYKLDLTARQIGYIVNFLKAHAKEPRLAKHHLHQFGIGLTLSNPAKELINKDTEDLQLQFLFAASFLLSTYPALFTFGNSHLLLKNIRDCLNIKLSRNRGDEYKRKLDEAPNVITSTQRSKIESVLLHRIVSGRESQPPAVMDVDRLSTAMTKLKEYINEK